MRDGKEDTDWRVSNVELKWYRGRDHQVVNPHRSGMITVDLWQGMANTNRTLRYRFADGTTLEHDPEDAMNTPEERKVAWFDTVVEGGHEVELFDDIVDFWKDMVEDEIELLGFEIVEESPDWHYVHNNE